ncbi:unnamed protein product [Arctia plantaginis]|uniref:Uncharacterized protein n=1 Tax=Arctia plantaginis TaxID=874455 RepID=A0A8S0ZJ76_ARCPL|nr:unnamed protein product [Arctia plantaginis]CAB3237488.1 unnamed protein product [Arctia plantaginis]
MKSPPESCPRHDNGIYRRIGGCAGGDREAPAGAHRPPRPLRLELCPARLSPRRTPLATNAPHAARASLTY